MEITDVSTEEWDRALPTTGFEVFHTPTALDVVDRHTPGERRLFVGYKGDNPVAMFPVFVVERAVGQAVLSPPPGMGIPQLGPLVMPASPKRRKRERLNREFVETVLERVGVDGRASLCRVVCSPAYPDPRPFAWTGMDVGTEFTYTLDTAERSPEELLRDASKSLRREVGDGRETDVQVTVEGAEAARRVYDQTSERYAEQGESYPLEEAYVADLTAALAEVGRCRVYVARDPDGEFLSGITVLYSNDAAYFWQGGTRATYDGVSINSLLHWHIVEDLASETPQGATAYDLLGANTERLCRYKSKFGGRLEPYHVVESGGTTMDIAKRAYQLVGR